ncbi:alpha/beta hydrolase [Nocardia sp. NPDC056064]|uniref:alpha/beta hydrolase n=1 Tax=Nocardia sp. NPDC056064 TaxID=3345701 RepID=UPI0035D665A0
MTVSRARAWKPETLGLHGVAWQLAAQQLMRDVTPVTTEAAGSGDYWAGEAADAMRTRVATIHTDAAKIAAALDIGATAATAGAQDISAHRQTVIKHVDDAVANTYDVADDGTVTPSTKMYTTLVARLGSARAMQAWHNLVADGADRSVTIKQALADLLAADLRTESAIHDAFKNLNTQGVTQLSSSVNIGEVPASDASVETNRHWWNSLTEAQKNALITTHPEVIGNRDGIPVEARDAANRNRLPGLIALAEGDQQTVAAQFGTDSDQYRAATAKLDDLKAVERAANQPATSEATERKLILLDTTSGRQTRAAVSVGDPDKSKHVSVTTPGLNTHVRGGIESMTTEAAALQQEASFQLSQKDRGDETVATVAWIGYDPPQIAGQDLAGQMVGGSEVGQLGQAAEGGELLNRFYNGLEASHTGGEEPHITAVGHSYGSLTTGLALQSGEHPVSDMVVYGSPGIAAETPKELGLDDGRAYVMRTEDDPIKWAQDGPKIAQAGSSLPGPVGTVGGAAGAWISADNGGFGSDPARNPNFTQLETHDSKSYDGSTRELPGAAGHSEYPRAGTNSLGQEVPRVTTYNVAAIVAGLPENVVEVR